MNLNPGCIFVGLSNMIEDFQFAIEPAFHLPTQAKAGAGGYTGGRENCAGRWQLIHGRYLRYGRT